MKQIIFIISRYFIIFFSVYFSMYQYSGNISSSCVRCSYTEDVFTYSLVSTLILIPIFIFFRNYIFNMIIVFTIIIIFNNYIVFSDRVSGWSTYSLIEELSSILYDSFPYLIIDTILIFNLIKQYLSTNNP